ncbi:MAG: cyclic pyranopterin monophosphate synthase MoaC, partial [Desulfopila sp.]|nr:cyclic pyranopterin monophosphate synthase MoaC [Desulfopila sp.]
MKETAFTHFDEHGNAVMVDVSGKKESQRVALACGSVSMSSEAYSLLKSGSIKKGDVLGVARIAGIMAAKKADSLIPLTHPLMITKSNIDFTLHDEKCAVEIFAEVG